MKSGSIGATDKDIQDVLEKNGYEIDKPEPAAEPERDTFATEEEFEAAHTEWQEAQEGKAATKKAEESEDEEDEQGRQPQPKLTRTQRKIQRATDKLAKENAELKQRLDALEGKAKPEKKDENPRPARADYQTDQEYEDALLDWGYKTRATKEQRENAERAERERLTEIQNNYRSQVEEFKEEHDDWEEVVNQDIPMHQAVTLAIVEQENGAEVAYYLGKHPDYARKLAEMSPLSAVMEVGRLSSRLKTGSPSTSDANGGANLKPKPKVPAPVRPVSTAATTSPLTSRAAAEKGNYKAFKAAQRMGR